MKQFLGLEMDDKEDLNNITVMMLIHRDWSPQKPTATQQDNHIITIMSPNTFWYVIEPQWPLYYNRQKPSLTTIICIHNLDTPFKARMRTPTTSNPQGGHPAKSSKPRELNYNVHFIDLEGKNHIRLETSLFVE